MAEYHDQANCAECPFALRGRTPSKVVRGIGRSGGLMVLGMNPGREEIVKGIPFVGPSGRLLDACLKREGYDRDQDAIHITNAALCGSWQRVPDETIERAIRCCRQRLAAEIAAVAPKAILATGAMAFRAACAEGGSEKLPSVLEVRGTMWTTAGDLGWPCPVIPTYHPAYILRAGSGESIHDHAEDIVVVYFAADVAKACTFAQARGDDGQVPPKILTTETAPIHVCALPGEALAALVALRAALDADGPNGRLAIDLETVGGKVAKALDVRRHRIEVFGLGTPDFAVSIVPPASSDPAVVRQLRALLASPITKVYQNRPFDEAVLISRGFIVRGPVDDVFYAHHVAYPDLPHDLQRIAAQYLAVEPWKTSFKMLGAAERDAVKPLPAALAAAEAAEQKLLEVEPAAYEAQKALEALNMTAGRTRKVSSAPLRAEVSARLRLDKARARLAAVVKSAAIWKQQYRDGLGPYNGLDVLTTARIIEPLKDDLRIFNVDHVYALDVAKSGVAMLMSLLGIPIDPAGRVKALDALSSRALEAAGSVIDHLDEAVKLPETLVGLDDPAAVVSEALGFNINASAAVAKFFESHGVILTKLTATGKIATSKKIIEGERDKYPIVDAVLDLRAALHDLGIYGASLPVDQYDGRLHAEWRPYDITGRWASSPNVQNWYRALMVQIAPPAGRLLVGGDLSQAELRIAALQGDDRWMLGRYAQPNPDIHTDSLKVVFADQDLDALDKATFKALREVTKNFEFCGIYGGSAETARATIRGRLAGYTSGDPATQAKVRAVAKTITIGQCAKALAIITGLFEGCTAQREYDLKRAIDQDTGPLGGEVSDAIFGRRRAYPLGRCSPNVIYNFPKQAGIAAIMDQGLLRFIERLDDAGLLMNVAKYAREVVAAEEAGQPCPSPVGRGAYPIVQIHDAIFAECDAEDATEVKRIMAESFTSDQTYTCPRTGRTNTLRFPMECKIGNNLADVK